jgi:hypothetical protein
MQIFFRKALTELQFGITIKHTSKMELLRAFCAKTTLVYKKRISFEIGACNKEAFWLLCYKTIKNQIRC